MPPSQVKLARQVMVARVEQRDLSYTVDTVGTLEPEQQTAIASGVSGVVDEVLFQEGDIVDSDTVLVRINQERYRSAAALAQANERQAQARLALAQDQLTRAVHLGERKAIAEEELRRRQLELDVTKAELAASEAARVMADHDLANSRVRPPYTGQINQRRVAPGDYVKEETVIATIADISRLRLTTWVPELAAARVKVGDTVEFELAALPGRRLQAKIFYLSTTADPQSHMFECKARVEPLDPDMKPGLFARVQIPTEQHPGACVIPEESVRAGERGFVAFVPQEQPAADGRTGWVASARRVELGFRRPGFVEVLSGVRPGELVVTRGAEALDDGTPIEFPADAHDTRGTAGVEGQKNGKT